MKIILKKENKEDWYSFTAIKKYKYKIIGYIMVFVYELKGYIVEVIEND